MHLLFSIKQDYINWEEAKMVTVKNRLEGLDRAFQKRDNIWQIIVSAGIQEKEIARVGSELSPVHLNFKFSSSSLIANILILGRTKQEIKYILCLQN